MRLRRPAGAIFLGFPARRLADAVLLGLAAATLVACQPSSAQAEGAVDAPAALRPAHETPVLHRALFAGGCYWGVEAVFSHLRGVTGAVSGFHGGEARTATYWRVGQGDTGHAESVMVTYDPAKIRYDQLLQVFFAVVADPTTRDRQGPDEGTQYRSALVPLDDEQKAVATAYLAQLGQAHLWKAPIVTRIEPYKQFYPAAADHQDFMLKNPDHPYILYWDAPKVAALKKHFPALWQAAFTRG